MGCSGNAISEFNTYEFSAFVEAPNVTTANEQYVKALATFGTDFRAYLFTSQPEPFFIVETNVTLLNSKTIESIVDKVANETTNCNNFEQCVEGKVMEVEGKVIKNFEIFFLLKPCIRNYLVESILFSFADGFSEKISEEFRYFRELFSKRNVSCASLT